MYCVVIQNADKSIKQVMGPFEKAIDADDSDSASYIANECNNPDTFFDVYKLTP